MTSPDELRERVADAIVTADERGAVGDYLRFADAVLAVVTPELDRLRQKRNENGERATEEYAARQEALTDLAAAENTSDYTFSALADRLEDLGLARPEGLADALDQTKWAMDILAWLHAEAVWRLRGMARRASKLRRSQEKWRRLAGTQTNERVHDMAASMANAGQLRAENRRVKAERDEALAALEKQQDLLARAVLVWPQDAMVRIRECIADPSRMGPRQGETVAGWGARAVIKLMESWRAPASESVPATPQEIDCKAGCPATADECRCAEQAWHRTCCHVTTRPAPLLEASSEASPEQVDLEPRVPETNGCWAHYGPASSASPAAGEADTTLRVWTIHAEEPIEEGLLLKANLTVWKRDEDGLWRSPYTWRNGALAPRSLPSVVEYTWDVLSGGFKVLTEVPSPSQGGGTDGQA